MARDESIDSSSFIIGRSQLAKLELAVANKGTAQASGSRVLQMVQLLTHKRYV